MPESSNQNITNAIANRLGLFDAFQKHLPIDMLKAELTGIDIDTLNNPRLEDIKPGGAFVLKAQGFPDVKNIRAKNLLPNDQQKRDSLIKIIEEAYQRVKDNDELSDEKTTLFIPLEYKSHWYLVEINLTKTEIRAVSVWDPRKKSEKESDSPPKQAPFPYEQLKAIIIKSPEIQESTAQGKQDPRDSYSCGDWIVDEIERRKVGENYQAKSVELLRLIHISKIFRHHFDDIFDNIKPNLDDLYNNFVVDRSLDNDIDIDLTLQIANELVSNAVETKYKEIYERIRLYRDKASPKLGDANFINQVLQPSSTVEWAHAKELTQAVNIYKNALNKKVLGEEEREAYKKTLAEFIKDLIKYFKHQIIEQGSPLNIALSQELAKEIDIEHEIAKIAAEIKQEKELEQQDMISKASGDERESSSSVLQATANASTDGVIITPVELTDMDLTSQTFYSCLSDSTDTDELSEIFDSQESESFESMTPTTESADSLMTVPTTPVLQAVEPSPQLTQTTITAATEKKPARKRQEVNLAQTQGLAEITSTDIETHGPRVDNPSTMDAQQPLLTSIEQPSEETPAIQSTDVISSSAYHKQRDLVQAKAEVLADEKIIQLQDELATLNHYFMQFKERPPTATTLKKDYEPKAEQLLKIARELQAKIANLPNELTHEQQKAYDSLNNKLANLITDVTTIKNAINDLWNQRVESYENLKAGIIDLGRVIKIFAEEPINPSQRTRLNIEAANFRTQLTELKEEVSLDLSLLSEFADPSFAIQKQKGTIYLQRLQGYLDRLNRKITKKESTALITELPLDFMRAQLTEQKSYFKWHNSLNIVNLFKKAIKAVREVIPDDKRDDFAAAADQFDDQKKIDTKLLDFFKKHLRPGEPYKTYLETIDGSIPIADRKNFDQAVKIFRSDEDITKLNEFLKQHLECETQFEPYLKALNDIPAKDKPKFNHAVFLAQQGDQEPLAEFLTNHSQLKTILNDNLETLKQAAAMWQSQHQDTFWDMSQLEAKKEPRAISYRRAHHYLGKLFDNITEEQQKLEEEAEKNGDHSASNKRAEEIEEIFAAYQNGTINEVLTTKGAKSLEQYEEDNAIAEAKSTRMKGPTSGG
ncbi:MAG: hypothetical protein K0S11_142 [Gammaproteobacteria bacterium]|nr:hypothetical protein [Gammaproteobacteria bacterium]